MAVTIKDVAKKAGVSISTVSKVINDSATISGATKDKVKKVMKELNYYPNIIARNFAQQNSYAIGVFMELKKSYAFINPFLYEILGGIEEVAHQNGYLLTLSNIDSIINSKNALDRIVSEKRVDGLIFHVPTINKSIVQKLEELDFPYIVIGQPCFESNICWVDINNRMAGEIATNHLIEEGCNRLAFIGVGAPDNISMNRKAGYKGALANKDMEINRDYIREGEPTVESGFKLMNEILDLPVLPDGVVCANSFTALGAMKAIQGKGLKIPQDIAIVGFDKYPLSEYTDPTLTVVDIDVFELGVHTANALMNKLKNPSLQVQYSMLTPKIVVGESSKKSSFR